MDPHSFYADPDPAVFLNADPDPDPDPGGKMNADPCGSGSGSTALVGRSQFCKISHIYLTGKLDIFKSRVQACRLFNLAILGHKKFRSV